MEPLDFNRPCVMDWMNGSTADSCALPPSDVGILRDVAFLDPVKVRHLTREQAQRQDESSTLGGLRRACTSVAKLPFGVRAGLLLRLSLLHALRACPTLLASCLDAVGSEMSDAGPTDVVLSQVRKHMSEHFNIVEQYDDSGLCVLWSSFFQAWRLSSMDPDEHVERWLRSGAPMGLRQAVPICGIFPVADDKDVGDPEQLVTPVGWEENTSGNTYSQAVWRLRSMLSLAISGNFLVGKIWQTTWVKIPL